MLFPVGLAATAEAVLLQIAKLPACRGLVPDVVERCVGNICTRTSVGPSIKMAQELLIMLPEYGTYGKNER